MADLAQYKSIPFGSILIRPVTEQERYVELLFLLPQNLKTVLTAPRTGAFVRGVAREANLDESKIPVLAYNIWQVGVGEKNIRDLATTIARDFQITPDKATVVAQEIEKEIFAPIAIELNQFLGTLRTPPTVTTPPPPSPAGGARNVLDLKQPPQPPLPPPLPR